MSLPKVNCSTHGDYEVCGSAFDNYMSLVVGGFFTLLFLGVIVFGILLGLRELRKNR